LFGSGFSISDPYIYVMLRAGAHEGAETCPSRCRPSSTASKRADRPAARRADLKTSGLPN
jgi:hypothetical protein